MKQKKLLASAVKKLLKIDADAVNPTGLNAAWSYCRNIYYYHPRQRFTNLIESRAKTALGSWKLMVIPESVIHRVFRIYLRKTADGDEVIKLPLGDNEFSYGVIQSLRDPEEFDRYRHVLQDSKLDPWLNKHCVTVTQIRRDGGYVSDYIKGFNLAHFRDEILNGQEISESLQTDLLVAIKELLDNLTGYHNEHGKLIGDWPFHNLIFSLEKRAIVNVDAEGFFTWHGTAQESRLSLIKANFSDLTQLIELLSNPVPDNAMIVDSLKILDEVRRSEEEYNGRYFLAGYHSLELRERKFRGQRECSERLSQIPFNFQAKSVIDLGCNCGGMLHALSKKIKAGYGIDFNPKCINAANVIKKLNRAANLEFYTFDLDRDDLSLIQSFLLGERADICFLLSVCMWLRRWRDVIQTASTLSDTLLFESNGTTEQQDEQVALLHYYYKRVQLLADSSADDFLQGARKLYLCSHM